MTEKNQTTNIIRKQANPVYASVSVSPYEEKESDRKKWNESFLRLPRFIRYGLSNKETEGKIIQSANRLGLKDAVSLGKISRLVRKFFLGEIKSGQIRDEAAERMDLNEDKAGEFEKFFKELIVFIGKKGKDLVWEDLDKGDIGELMSQYKEIKKQRIGKDYLEIEGEGELPPTIENWIYDYKSKVGTGNRNLLQESGYVYNSKNAKNLSQEDKEKLSLIIKSYNDKRKIFYNKLYKEIDFEASLNPEKVFGGKIEAGIKDSNIKNFKISPYLDMDYQDKKNNEEDFVAQNNFLEAKDNVKEKKENGLQKKPKEDKIKKQTDNKSKGNTLNLNEYI